MKIYTEEYTTPWKSLNCCKECEWVEPPAKDDSMGAHSDQLRNAVTQICPNCGAGTNWLSGRQTIKKVTTRRFFSTHVSYTLLGSEIKRDQKKW